MLVVKRLYRAGLIIVAFLCSANLAADPVWVDIPVKQPGTHTAFDSSSLLIDGTRRIVWLEIRFVPAQRLPRVGLVSRIVSLVTFDCFRRTSRSMQAVIYAPNGHSSEEADPNETAERVKKGTVSQAQLDAVCSTVKPK